MIAQVEARCRECGRSPESSIHSTFFPRGIPYEDHLGEGVTHAFIAEKAAGSK